MRTVTPKQLARGIEMDTLDQWEADAKRIPMITADDRILALIDLVRRQQAAFKNIADGPAENWVGNSCRQEARLALALTENLK
jgi:hypothetical protein